MLIIVGHGPPIDCKNYSMPYKTAFLALASSGVARKWCKMGLKMPELWVSSSVDLLLVPTACAEEMSPVGMPADWRRPSPSLDQGLLQTKGLLQVGQILILYGTVATCASGKARAVAVLACRQAGEGARTVWSIPTSRCSLPSAVCILAMAIWKEIELRDQTPYDACKF